MNARAASYAVLFAMSLLVASAATARAGAWSLAPGEYYTSLTGGWSSSDHFYDQDGTKLPLAGGGLWEQRSLLSYSELGWKKKVSFVLGIPAVSVNRRFGRAMGGREVPTATGLGDALVGFKWDASHGRWAAGLEVDWKPPLGYERDRFLTPADSLAAGSAIGDADSLDLNVASHLGSPVLGDGQNDVTFLFHLGTTLAKRGFVEMSTGYKFRFEKALDQVVARASAGVWLGRSLLLAGRYDGEVTLTGLDLAPISVFPVHGTPPTIQPERHRVGSMLVYRVDDRMDLVVSTMHTAAASNALHTDEVYVGVAFRQTKLNRLQGFLGNASNP